MTAGRQGHFARLMDARRRTAEENSVSQDIRVIFAQAQVQLDEREQLSELPNELTFVEDVDDVDDVDGNDEDLFFSSSDDDQPQKFEAPGNVVLPIQCAHEEALHEVSRQCPFTGSCLGPDCCRFADSN